MALRDLHTSRRSQIPWDSQTVLGYLQRMAAWPGAGSKVPTFIPFPRISLVFPPVFYRDKKSQLQWPRLTAGTIGCPANECPKAEDRNTDLGQGEMWSCEHREMGCRGAGAGPAEPAQAPPSPRVTLLARALSPALGTATLSLAPGAPVAARPLSKYNTRWSPAWKTNCPFTPSAAHAGLFLPSDRGGNARMWMGKPTQQTPGYQRRPPFQGGQEPQEEEERMDPSLPWSCSPTTIQPRGCRTLRSL